MSKEVDSGALLLINRTLGIAGRGSAQTDLDDGNLTQVIDVNPIVRRSKTLASFEGVYTGLLRNVHAVAGQLTSTIDPYALAVGAGAGFPDVVPAQSALDIWLIGACVFRLAGAGTLDGATLETPHTAAQKAFGIDDSGVAVDASGSISLGHWDAILGTVNTDPATTPQGNTWVPIGLRLARASTGLRFISDVAGASATIQCNMLIGVFPSGLGQDIAS